MVLHQPYHQVSDLVLESVGLFAIRFVYMYMYVTFSHVPFNRLLWDCTRTLRLFTALGMIYKQSITAFYRLISNKLVFSDLYEDVGLRFCQRVSLLSFDMFQSFISLNRCIYG